jgi:hypothetical protein
MYNIKIKSVPNRAKTGQQLDYSLVDRNTLFLKPDTQVQSDVKNTISAVPRDKANIEAEGGETIIGDTNNDGFLEHQTIVGKRHSKGGVPLNVPEGSFIFSDTDKLRIKDPEILKMFGMPANKKGYTPAEIAKKYQVNDYMAILKDDTKDKYSKETAQVMLDSNLKKLGMLALVQESMKGFPDGVPAIAESVMEGLMGGGAAEQQEEEQQGQPEARYGGLTQYQTKGEVKDTYASTYLQNNSDADLSDPFFKNVIKPGETHFDTNLNRQVPNLQTPAEYRYSIENNNWRGDGDAKGQYTLMDENDYNILTEINDDNYNSATSNKTKYTADERLATAMKYYKQNYNKNFAVPEVYSASDIDRQGTKDAQGNYINLPASKELQTQYNNTLTRRYGGTQLPKAQFGVPLFGAPIPVTPTNGEPAKDETTTTEAEPDWNLSEDTMLTAPGAIPLDEVVVRQKKLNAIPKIGDVYYVDGQPIKVSDIEMSSTGDWLPNWLNDPQGIYFSPAGTTDYGSKNKKYYLTFDEFKKLRELDPQTGNAPVLRKHGRTASSWWTMDSNRAYNFSTVPTSQPTRYYGSRDNNIAIDQNDILELPNGKYKVIDTQYGVTSKNPFKNPAAFSPVFYADQYYTEQTIRAKNLTTGQVEELNLDELKEKFDAGFAKNLTKYPEAATTNPDGTPATGEWNITGNDSTEVNSMGVEEEVKSKEVGKTATVPVVKKPKVNTNNNSSNVNPTFGGFETPTDTIRGYAYGGSMYKMRVGGTPRFNPDTGMWQNYDAQGKPVGAPYKGTGTTYNVKDKDLQEKARAAGYEVIGNKYAPNINYVPEQTSKTGFKWNPESGYYESSQLPIGKQGLEETINIWKDELDQYSGPSGTGAEAWRKDFLNQKGKEGAASKYLVDKANEYSVAAGFGPQVDVTQKAAYVPGQDVFSLKKFKKAPAQVEQKVDNTPSIEKGAPEIMQQAITPTIGRKTRGWFTPDMLNLANAFGRRIGKFPPTLRQVAFQTGPYNLLSPEGEIAKIQSSGNMLSNQAANTMAGNVGFGASMGVQGQAIDKVTDTQGKYSNANVGISNEASRLGSGVFNQGQLANTQLLSAFDRDRAIYGQNLINSINAKNLGMTRAFNKGWDNSFKANMLEDMFPQVGIDRIYGDIGWSGVGRDYHTYDTYINPLTAAASSKGRRTSQDFDWDDDDWKEMSAFTNKGIENGLSKDQAYALASKMVMAKKSRNNAYDPYNPAQSVYAGLGSMGWDNRDIY